MIDGLCWRRSLFERLKPEAPFSPLSSYNIDGNWPATLLSPLMNSTPCDDLRRWRNYSAGETRIASQECYPRLVRVEHQISRIDIREAVRVIKHCRELGASRCFAVKGFHRTDILEAFERRVKNDPETEFNEAIAQVHRIAKLRLEAL